MMDVNQLTQLIRHAATLIEDLRNGFSERELHMSPDDWRAQVETLFNMNRMSLDD